MNQRFVRVLVVALAIVALHATSAQTNNMGGVAPHSLQLFSAGLGSLKQADYATTLRDIVALPETKALETNLFDRIAPVLSQNLTAKPSNSAGSSVQAIRLLLDDLLEAPLYLEIQAGSNNGPSWVLAVRLEGERGTRWQESAKRLAAGWRLRSGSNIFEISTFSTNSWQVLASSGGGSGSTFSTDPFKSARAVFQRSSPSELGQGQILRVEGDLSLLFPGSWLGSASSTSITIQGKGESVRTEARIHFANPINWKPDAWRIPTNSIQDPNGTLFSFTAVRGFAEKIAAWPWVKKLGLSEMPNQLFAWEDAHAQFQVFAAVPLEGSTNWLRQYAGGKTNLGNLNPGELEFRPENARLTWSGLPWIIPYVTPAVADGGKFLIGGVFPMTGADSSRAPAELFEQLNSRTNMIYYDWEITELRLAHLRPLTQLMSLIFTIPQIDATSPISKWLAAAAPKLGNTVTEASLVSPLEISVIRNSPVGLNGLELLVLAHWMQTEEFPRLPKAIETRPNPAQSMPPVPQPGF